MISLIIQVGFHHFQVSINELDNFSHRLLISSNSGFQFYFSQNNNPDIIKFKNSPINSKAQDFVDYTITQDSLIPILYKSKKFYKPTNPFIKEIDAEIGNLYTLQKPSLEEFPFLDFYYKTEKQFISNIPKTDEELPNYLNATVQLFKNTNENLELSGLMREILTNYLSYSNAKAKSKDESLAIIRNSVDSLLDQVNRETQRGQLTQLTIINILESYGQKQLVMEYYNKASQMKCDIIPSLKSKFEKIESLKISKVFPNTNFTKNVLNTNEKSINDVKSKYKIISIWVSNCTHCMAELNFFKNNYAQIKEKGGEIIGLSLDTDHQKFKEVVAELPWINDTELNFDSSYYEKYNVVGTPTVYILDEQNKIITINPKINDIIGYLR